MTFKCRSVTPTLDNSAKSLDIKLEGPSSILKGLWMEGQRQATHMEIKG